MAIVHSLLYSTDVLNQSSESSAISDVPNTPIKTEDIDDQEVYPIVHCETNFLSADNNNYPQDQQSQSAPDIEK